MKNGNIIVRVKFSFAGVLSAWTRERSFRTQALLAMAIIVTCVWVQPSAVWWAIMLLAISCGSAMELLNGAFETVIDHLHPAQHPEIGVAKDMASAAAFVANCATGLAFMVMLATELL